MRKILMAGLVLFIAFCHNANAQYGYIRVAGGGSWNNFTKTGQVLAFKPTGTDPAGSIIIPMINFDSIAGIKKNINDGYSRGGTLSIFGGYMINPYFGIELGVTYLWGATISSESRYNDNALLNEGYTLRTRASSSGLSLMPGFYLRAAKPESKFAPYARLGLSLPVFGATNHDISIDGSNLGLLGPGVSTRITSEVSVKTESTVSLGVNGGIGITYTPIPLITVLAEMNAQYLFVRPDVSKLTKYNLTLGESSSNVLETLSTYSTETKFVDELTSASNTTIFGKQRVVGDKVDGVNYVEEDKPRQELRQSANFSGIGFSIGIGINLSKTIFKNPTGKKAAN